MQIDDTTVTPDDLRAWRVLAGLTQDAAAVQLGVPLHTYIRWERGLGIRHPRILALALAAIRDGMPPWRTPSDLVIDAPRRRGRPARKAAIVI